MTYEEKLDLIVKAVVEASKTTRKGVFTTTLYLNATNGLDQLPREEIHNILLQLQDEKALKVHPLNNRLLPANQQPTHFFTLDIPDFKSWYERRLIANKSKLENLSETNFNNISHIMDLIEEQLELDQSEKLAIDFITSSREIEGYEPEDVNDIINTYVRSLTYLKNTGVVKDFTTAYMTLSSDLTLNIARFFEVLEQINSFRQKKQNTHKKEKTSNKPLNKTDVVYEITYTKQRQILMNNAQIGRPDFNSENDLVFSFLYTHPNESFTIEQIEKAIGSKLNKSLHKIVENLGFEGDTKEVFISVSKNAIQFRNPITKKDLEEMKKMTIKLVKGGGKLLLPR